MMIEAVIAIPACGLIPDPVQLEDWRVILIAL